MEFEQTASQHRRIAAPTLMIVWLFLATTPDRSPAATSNAPLSQRQYKTTSAAIALANLNSYIHDLERFGLAGAAERVDLLLTRGQYLGQIADYEHADALAIELIRARPADPTSYITRARTRSRLHRFADALLDLDEAERRGGAAMVIDGLRAGIWQATGQFDQALAVRRRQAANAPDIVTLGAVASLLADRGETAEADRLFQAAQDSYGDVAPFPLCWLYERQGLMWLHAGDLERAREFYAAARERIPQYPAVAAQLSWLEAARGNGDVALTILKEAASTSDDPFAASLLAKALQLAGERSESDHWRERARARYEDLLRTHPEAFAHHAAEFFLSAGADPRRALALARGDLANRNTPAAVALVLRAAVAAGEEPVACEAAAIFLRFPGYAPSASPFGDRAAAERAHAHCKAGVATASPAPARSEAP